MNPACIQLDFSYLYIFPEFGQETMVTSPVYATVIHVFALHVCLPPERVEINQNNPGMFNKRDFNRSVYYERMLGISSFTPRFLPWGQSLYLVISLIEDHFESQWRRKLQIKKIYILKQVPVHSPYYMNLPVYFTKVHKTRPARFIQIKILHLIQFSMQVSPYKPTAISRLICGKSVSEFKQLQDVLKHNQFSEYVRYQICILLHLITCVRQILVIQTGYTLQYSI